MKKLSAKTQQKLYIAAIVIFSVILCCSLCVLGWYMWQSEQAKSSYEGLEDIVNAARPTAPSVSTQPSTEPTEPSGSEPVQITEPTESTEPTSPWVTVIDPDTGEERQILPEYADIYLMNTDLVGWISIEGTSINYPVTQTPDHPDYYLRRDFYKQYSTAGCIYVKEEADVFKPSDNVTIYGHRMSDGSMFYPLTGYTQESFWQEHQYIQFDTLTERHTYQIAFVFKTTATLNQGFPYHRFVDAYNENAFNAFVLECGWNQFYDTGVEVVYGDKLITLSTCEYSQPNGRLVVVAKRIS